MVIFGLLSPSQTSKLSLQMKWDKTLSCRRVCHVCSIGYVRVCTVVLYVCVFGLHCVSLRLLFFPGSAYVRNLSPCGCLSSQISWRFLRTQRKTPSHLSAEAKNTLYFWLRPLTSSEDTESKLNIISITKWNTLIWGNFEDIYKNFTRLLRLKETAESKMQNLVLKILWRSKWYLICYRCLHLNLMASAEGGAPAHPSYEGAVP